MTTIATTTVNPATKINKLNLTLGVIGLLLIVYGTLIPVSITQKIFFLCGSVFLLTSSTLEKHEFFIILQIVAFVGTAVAFLPFSPFIKAAIPILLSALGILYLISKGMLKDRANIIGCIGLVFLALGYAISNPTIYFLGGIFLAWYSYLSYRKGVKIAMVFFILNVVFCITSGIGVYRLLFT